MAHISLEHHACAVLKYLADKEHLFRWIWDASFILDRFFPEVKIQGTGESHNLSFCWPPWCLDEAQWLTTCRTSH